MNRRRLVQTALAVAATAPLARPAHAQLSDKDVASYLSLSGVFLKILGSFNKVGDLIDATRFQIALDDCARDLGRVGDAKRAVRRLLFATPCPGADQFADRARDLAASLDALNRSTRKIEEHVIDPDLKKDVDAAARHFKSIDETKGWTGLLGGYCGSNPQSKEATRGSVSASLAAVVQCQDDATELKRQLKAYLALIAPPPG